MRAARGDGTESSRNGADECLIKQQTSVGDLERSVSRMMEHQRIMRSIFEQNADGIIVVDSQGHRPHGQ
jgi:PAS domain-containing protein